MRTDDGEQWTDDGSMVSTPLLRFGHHLAEFSTDVLTLGEHGVLLRFRDLVAGECGRNPMLTLRLFPIGIRQFVHKVSRITPFLPCLGDIHTHRPGGPPDLVSQRKRFFLRKGLRGFENSLLQFKSHLVNMQISKR